MMTGGAAVAAAIIAKRNNERKEKDSKSHIQLEIENGETDMTFSMQKEEDWAIAAWVLVNTCIAKGQYDTFKNLMENEAVKILDGSLDEK